MSFLLGGSIQTWIRKPVPIAYAGQKQPKRLFLGRGRSMCSHIETHDSIRMELSQSHPLRECDFFTSVRMSFCLVRAYKRGFGSPHPSLSVDLPVDSCYNYRKGVDIMNLAGKTVLFLGSSVTYGWATDGVSFADIMAKRGGFTCVKEAVSGTTITDVGEQSYVARLKKLDTSMKLDLVICQLSANDATRRLPLSGVEGAVRDIVEYTRSTFDCPIAFYTNAYFDNAQYKEMVGTLFRLSLELDFHVLDIYNDPDAISVLEKNADKYMKDALHPTLLGYREWWTPMFEHFVHGL